MKKYILLCIALHHVFSVVAYDCKRFDGLIGQKRKANFEASNVVFFGVVTQVSDNVGVVKIKEVYKGGTDSICIVKFANDVDSNDVFRLWIIYGIKETNNDTVYVSPCSMSHSYNGDLLSPPPPKRKQRKDKLFIYSQHTYEKLQLIEKYLLFYEELEVLRIIKE